MLKGSNEHAATGGREGKGAKGERRDSRGFIARARAIISAAEDRVSFDYDK